MLIEDWMSKDVITVDAKHPLQKAVNLMKDHDIRMLPVMQDDRLVGVVSNGDVKKASVRDAAVMDVEDVLYRSYKLKVEDIMSPDPVTVRSDHTVSEAAEILLQHKISRAPVVDPKGNLVGVITQTDMFKVIMSLSGMGARGIQFGFYLKDQSGSINAVTDVIRSYGGSIASILSSYEKSPPGHRQVHIRAFNLDPRRLPELIKELQAGADLLYMVNAIGKRREIYRK